MASLFDPLIDFRHLEAAEAVDHIKRVVFHSTRSYMVDDGNEDMYDSSFRYDDCWELDGMTWPCAFEAGSHRKPRKFKKINAAGEQPCLLTSNKGHLVAARVQRALNRWVSLVAAVRRRANGCGMTWRQQRLFRERQRRDREQQLGLVEKPTRMPRHERWLRSPFVDENADNYMRGTLSKSLKETKATNDVTEGKHKCHRRAVADCGNRTIKCATCGCSAEFDAFGDRLCWCDSCQQSGCSRTSKLPPPAIAHSPLSRWKSLGITLLEKHHMNPLPKGRFGRRIPPMVSTIRRWLFIHGVEDKHHALETRLSEYETSRPYELTLSYQVACADRVQQRRQERRVWRRWYCMIRNLHVKACADVRRAALHDAASSRRQRGLRSNLNYLANSSVPITVASTSIAGALRTLDDETLAAQLGVDVATYQMLKQLEQREIMPEDYDLLGRLDEAVKLPTLSPGELDRFPIHAHCTTVSTSSSEDNLINYGFDFWRLPLPALLPEVESGSTVAIDCVCSSFRFWHLPLPAFDDETDLASTAASGVSHEDSGVVCGVCLVEFEDGDQVRQLPCGHYFHRECIDHWLLNASTVCPIDKRDVRESR